MSGRAAPRRQEARRRAARTTRVRIVATRVHLSTGVVMSARFTVGIALIWLLALCGVARAQTTKTFINYFQPTPISCSLTANAWGCTATGSTPPNCVSGQGVVPRDTCNGIESSTNPPGYYYWTARSSSLPTGPFTCSPTDGPAPPGVGPYTDMGYAYSNSSFGSEPAPRAQQSGGRSPERHVRHDRRRGRPVHGFHRELSRRSLDTLLRLARLRARASLRGFGGNTNYASNVSLVVRPDGNFEITQRHGLLALSTNGIVVRTRRSNRRTPIHRSEAHPFRSTAPASSPTGRSIRIRWGRRRSSPRTPSAEDPVIWFSGGQYHVLRLSGRSRRLSPHRRLTASTTGPTRDWPTTRATRSTSSATRTARSTTGTRWSGPNVVLGERADHVPDLRRERRGQE